MNPRFARHVALPAPNETEGGQWYFQRYVEQLPTRGEITFFDRSWYNRAGVERVMDSATRCRDSSNRWCPLNSSCRRRHSSRQDLALVGRDEQDPAQRQWKPELSSTSGQPALWEDYTLAALELFPPDRHTRNARWFVNNNNKRVGRLNAIQARARARCRIRPEDEARNRQHPPRHRGAGASAPTDDRSGSPLNEKRSYSPAIARRTSSFAARRAGETLPRARRRDRRARR